MYERFDLADRLVLIAGGAGEVGEGIAQELLNAGARVIVPSRSQEKLLELRNRLDVDSHQKLFTIVADTTTEAGMEELRDKIERNHGVLFGVVASLGGWWSLGDLHEVSFDEWQQVLAGGLTAHFLLAKTFLPVLNANPGSSYTLINGGGALQPVPKSGVVSIVSSAQLMFKDVLAYEHQARVRVNTLLLATPVITRSRPTGPSEWLTSKDAGFYCLYLASRHSNHHGETIHFRSREQLALLGFN